MASIIYTRGKALFSGSTDWSATDQSFGLLLASNEYQPDRSHKFISEVSAELDGVGYNRKELTGRAIEEDDDAGRCDCMADAVTYRGLSTRESYKWAIVYKIGTNDRDGQLVCAIDMGEVSLKGISRHTIEWAGGESRGRVFSFVSPE